MSIANAILKPSLSEFLELAHDRAQDLELVEMTVGDRSRLSGCAVDEYDAEEGLVIVAVKRAGESMRLRPAGDATIDAGDVIIVAGGRDALARLERHVEPGSRAA